MGGKSRCRYRRPRVNRVVQKAERLSVSLLNVNATSSELRRMMNCFPASPRFDNRLQAGQVSLAVPDSADSS